MLPVTSKYQYVNVGMHDVTCSSRLDVVFNAIQCIYVITSCAYICIMHKLRDQPPFYAIRWSEVRKFIELLCSLVTTKLGKRSFS